MSVEEIFPTLQMGARIVLRPREVTIPGQEFETLIEATQIDALNLPTAFWSEWVRQIKEGVARIPPTVKLVSVGGEEARIESLQAWCRYSHCAWMNAYGPTEATVNATYFEVREQPVALTPL